MGVEMWCDFGEAFDKVLFKEVFETNDTMMLLVEEATGDILEANPAALRFFGYSPDEMRKKSVFDLNLNSREELTSRYLSHRDEKRSYFAGPQRLANGEIRIIESFVSRMTLGGRSVLLSIVHDITERTSAEAALQERERRFRELANDLPLCIYECDLRGTITFTNVICNSWFGYSPAEVAAGKVNILDTVIPEDRALAAENTRAILNGKETPPNEYRAVRKDGTVFSVLIQSRPIFENGAPVGMRGIIVDVSERKRLEDAILRAQKLESLGALAGGIAHDFNNLLTGMFGYVDLARLQPEASPRLRELLDNAVEPFSRARALTRQLLTFAKGGAPEKTAVDLAAIVKTAATFALSGSNVRAEFTIRDGLRHCSADANQISRVIDNIILNARQAMPLGGTVAIVVENADAHPALLAPGDYVRIEIKDSGIGIPRELLPRIFDPFFTTKQEGSGLGLATAYSIVKKHGGEIVCVSELTKGTTFTVYLPATESTGADVAAAPGALKADRPYTILIVDDEEFVRLIGKTILEQGGHRVSLAAGGDEALRLFLEARASGASVEIVILDLTIPGSQGGCAILEGLRRIDPSIKAIVSSGYSNDPVMADPAKYGFNAKLPKPFLSVDIERAVLEAVSDPTGKS
jgi:two-component system, cell cycle sensor histidine kinase and response regulator CckA